MSGTISFYFYGLFLMFPFSGSMDGDRAIAMIEAGKRWVKYEIPDSVKLGMAIFSDDAPPYQNMTEINDANRDLLINKGGFHSIPPWGV